MLELLERLHSMRALREYSRWPCRQTRRHGETPGPTAAASSAAEPTATAQSTAATTSSVSSLCEPVRLGNSSTAFTVECVSVHLDTKWQVQVWDSESHPLGNHLAGR